MNKDSADDKEQKNLDLFNTIVRGFTKQEILEQAKYLCKSH